MYEMSYDPPTKILELRLTGFWKADDFAAFERDYVQRLRRLPTGARRIGLLSDSREFKVQSPEVAAGFARLPHLSEGRIAATAIVVGSMLNKLQAQRAMPSPHVGVFLDMDSAATWLGEQLAADRAPSEGRVAAR